MNNNPPIVYSARGRCYALLIRFIANFISHNIEDREPVDIIAITNVVGKTATQFLRQDPVQQLQFCHGGNANSTTSQATRKSKLLLTESGKLFEGTQ